MAIKTAFNSYREAKVKTASQARLVVMLYEEAIYQVTLAVEKMQIQPIQPEDIPEINIAINKAQDVIGELVASLDFEKGGQIAENLFNIYNYFNRELTQANLTKKVENLPGVIKLLTDLKEAWVAIDANKPDPERGAINIAG